MRRGRPSLMGTMARTAVIAGTATAVSGSVANSQQQRAAAASQQQAAQQAAFESQQKVAEIQQQLDAMQTQQAQATVAAAMPAPAPAANDMMSQLTNLADLKTKGLLTDEEFAAAKAKLLAG